MRMRLLGRPLLKQRGRFFPELPFIPSLSLSSFPFYLFHFIGFKKGMVISPAKKQKEFLYIEEEGYRTGSQGFFYHCFLFLFFFLTKKGDYVRYSREKARGNDY